MAAKITLTLTQEEHGTDEAMAQTIGLLDGRAWDELPRTAWQRIQEQAPAIADSLTEYERGEEERRLRAWNEGKPL